MKTERKPQRQKPGKVQQVQELRRSNAAQPHIRHDRRDDKYKHRQIIIDDEDDDYSAFEWHDDGNE